MVFDNGRDGSTGVERYVFFRCRLFVFEYLIDSGVVINQVIWVPGLTTCLPSLSHLISAPHIALLVHRDLSSRSPSNSKLLSRIPTYPTLAGPPKNSMMVIILRIRVMTMKTRYDQVPLSILQLTFI